MNEDGVVDAEGCTSYGAAVVTFDKTSAQDTYKAYMRKMSKSYLAARKL